LTKQLYYCRSMERKIALQTIVLSLYDGNSFLVFVVTVIKAMSAADLLTNQTSSLPKIVIVGGGAGGLELATKLGNTVGKKKKAEITLVDQHLTHVWKPLLHEIASGTMDSQTDDVQYLAQANWNHFTFRLGRLFQVDRKKKEIHVAHTIQHPDTDAESDNLYKVIPYDTLIIAVGSTSNDFGIEGIADHCIALDTRSQAEAFHTVLLKRMYLAQTSRENPKNRQLNIAIAGAGATGVELAAELHESTRALVSYGLHKISPDQDINITIIEAADRVLPALPQKLSDGATKALEKINIELKTNVRISKADTEGFYTSDGELIPANIKVWAAGIKAPSFLAEIDGLETNRINQLVVKSTLQTSNDDNIFAFGDCAQCPIKPGADKFVPPRAQSAHQQAELLYKTVRNILKDKELPEYHYNDYGSLINLGNYNTVGNLMGNLLGKGNATSLTLEGLKARFLYRSLYKMHQVALFGLFGTILTSIGMRLIRRPRRRLKFH